MPLFREDVRALTGGEDPALLLLDLDGTLIDSVPDLASACDFMLTELGRAPAGIEKVSLWIGNGADKLVRRALADGCEQAAEELPDAEVGAARIHFDRAYLRVLTEATGAFPGVEAFLQALTIPAILITNKPRLFTLPLLRSLGWQDHFVKVICGDDLKEKKPSPVPVQFACEWQRTVPERALMIGDSVNDIRAAHAAGAAAIAVSYGYNHGHSIHSAGADLVCDQLQELLEI